MNENRKVYCSKCNKYIDKYYFNIHTRTRKHLLGISAKKQNKLEIKFSKCVLIFD
jgi:hypothetical protein